MALDDCDIKKQNFKDMDNTENGRSEGEKNEQYTNKKKTNIGQVEEGLKDDLEKTGSVIQHNDQFTRRNGWE